jgi:hypothetical protein
LKYGNHYSHAGKVTHRRSQERQPREPELAGENGEADGAAIKDAATNPNDQWQQYRGTKIFKNRTQILL